jgi:hypothetical protein
MTLLLSIALAFLQVAQGAAVEGSLIKAGSSERVQHARARVLLTKVDGRLEDSRTVWADDNGRFVVRNIIAGRYRLFAIGDGYVQTEYSLTITLSAGQQLRNISVEMIPTGVIVGRILNLTNEPLPRVMCALSRLLNKTACVFSHASVTQAQTNDLGEYRLYGLYPGQYFVSAALYDPPRIEGQTYIVPTPPCFDCRGEGQAMMSLSRLLTAGDFIDPRAVQGTVSRQTYFPGTIDPAAALPIDLAPGATFDVGDLLAR